MYAKTSEILDIRLAAGRVLGIIIVTLGLLLTAAGAVRPAAGASDQTARCISDLARVQRDIGVWVGGDHVLYHFGDRVRQAERLCRQGDVGKGRNLLAEIKSDLRAVRAERGER